MPQFYVRVKIYSPLCEHFIHHTQVCPIEYCYPLLNPIGRVPKTHPMENRCSCNVQPLLSICLPSCAHFVHLLKIVVYHLRSLYPMSHHNTFALPPDNLLSAVSLEICTSFLLILYAIIKRTCALCMFNVRLKIEHKYFIIILGAICGLCELFTVADGLPRWSPNQVLAYVCSMCALCFLRPISVTKYFFFTSDHR